MNEFPGFITELPELDLPFEGVTGYLLQGETQQAVFLSFEAETVVPAHSHRAQWELVLAGEVDLAMDGKKTTMTAGQQFYIPAGVEHSALVRVGYRAIVFFDQPDRYHAK